MASQNPATKSQMMLRTSRKRATVLVSSKRSRVGAEEEARRSHGFGGSSSAGAVSIVWDAPTPRPVRFDVLKHHLRIVPYPGGGLPGSEARRPLQRVTTYGQAQSREHLLSIM